jgi:hypothetical protein
MKQIIVDAINNLQVLMFNYSGIPRVVEPHTIGLSRTGKLVLRCFQTHGGHITPGHEWDLCDVDKISNLTVTGGNFYGPRSGYKRGDRHMLSIFAQL